MQYESLFSAKSHSTFYTEYMKSPQWQQVRRYAILIAGGRCQRCRDFNPSLDVHHLHYKTLGRESLCDLQVLCRSCHKIADDERRSKVWENRVTGFARKKYGFHWERFIDFDDAELEFSDWIERRGAA